MPRRRKELPKRKGRQLRSDSVQVPEIEGLSVEPVQVERPMATSQSQTTQTDDLIVDSARSGDSLPCPTAVIAVSSEASGGESRPRDLNFVQTRLDPPVVNLSESSSQSLCSNVISQPNLVKSTDPPKSYLSLKLVKDSIPKFDGKSDSLIKFIKQCRLLNSKVKPSDRENLLFLIRGKIEGHANLALSNRREATTLDELIDLLKGIFAQSFNVHDMNAGLMNTRQYLNETVEIFGARINEILNSGLETARDAYNPELLVGVIDLLKNTSIISFIKGLQNQTARFYLNRQKDNGQLPDLETAISIASKIESEMVSHPGSSALASSQSGITSAKIFKADFENRNCYFCNQTGHLRRDCPKARESQMNPPDRGKIRCSYCKKTGHLEAHCYKKQNQGVSQSHGESSQQSTLNSQWVPRAGATWNKPLIASTKTNEAASKSK